MKRLLPLLLFSVFISWLCLIHELARAEPEVKLEIKPDRENFQYSLGDTVIFKVAIRVPDKIIPPFQLRYKLSEDGERILREGKFEADSNCCEIRGSLDRPGFLRLDMTMVSGSDTVRQPCAVGFAVEAIRPTNILPADFDRFWRSGKAELLRIPIDARVEPLPEKDLSGSKYYKVSLANIEGTRIHGWLTVPVGRGSFPAVLYLPGAGVGELGHMTPYADSGMVVLSLNIHGLPTGLDEEYNKSLRTGLLSGYAFFGSDDPYRYYYRRVILGAFRALDYLSGREDVDAARLSVAGSSQGGALSLLAGGLDNRIKAVVANVPAMCDHTGCLSGRPSGWPRILRNRDTEGVRRTCGYYDAALTAGLIRVPALLAVGFIDDVCAPTTVYAAYNNLQGAKRIDNFPGMGHSYAEGWQAMSAGWLLEVLNRK